MTKTNFTSLLCAFLAELLPTFKAAFFLLPKSQENKKDDARGKQHITLYGHKKEEDRCH
tara:strand:- start:276 stop:452 length:177 start_codon:yes stop_codon:yes gene_type:complete